MLNLFTLLNIGAFYDKIYCVNNLDPSLSANELDRYSRCKEDYARIGFLEAKPTGGRFNLIPAERRHSDQFARDVLVPDPNPSKGLVRRLVFDRQLVDMDMYHQLVGARVPVLELVGETELLAVFAVPPGAKLLRHEPRHTGIGSSPTYISDAEIYQEAGRLGGAAWQATRKVPVGGPDDSPTTRIAITSFLDEDGHYLFLCPPYGGTEAATAEEAREIFLSTLPNKMSAAALADVGELIGAAAIGFGPLPKPD